MAREGESTCQSRKKCLFSPKFHAQAQPHGIEVSVDIRVDEQPLEPELKGRLEEYGESVAELMVPAHPGEETVADVVKIFGVGFFGIN